MHGQQWHQQPQGYGHQPTAAQMPGGVPGHPQPGTPPGYGPPGRPGTTMATVAVLSLVPPVVYGIVSVIVGWGAQPGIGDGGFGLALSMIGYGLAGVVGTVDLAIALTIVLVCIVALCTAVFAAGVGVMRWVLAVLIFVVLGLHLHSIIELGVKGGAEYLALPLVSLYLWTVPFILVMLPSVGHALRERAQRKGRHGTPAPPPPGTYGRPF